MPPSLVLYQPDIPQNTGTLIRLCACLGVTLHIIHPTGFSFSDRSLRRAGMDYLAAATIVEHDSYARFDAWRRAEGRRLVLMTSKTADSAYAAAYRPADLIMAGRESAGVPDAVAADADLRVRLPMMPGQRSLNVAVASAMVLGEALRQTGTLPALNALPF